MGPAGSNVFLKRKRETRKKRTKKKEGIEKRTDEIQDGYCAGENGKAESGNVYISSIEISQELHR